RSAAVSEMRRAVSAGEADEARRPPRGLQQSRVRPQGSAPGSRRRSRLILQMHAPDKRAVVWSLAIAASLVFIGPVHGRAPKHRSAPRRRAGAVVKAASVPENSVA